MPLRLPKPSDRVSIMGSTGSGKTHFGAWLLSHAALKRQPYIIFDWKREELLNSIPNVPLIGLNEKLPKHPGLYMVHCNPKADDVLLEKYLWKVWEHERVGLYFDEAYQLPKQSDALAAVLTQGRSKHIPAYCLTQRPAWISRFVFSEANFFAVFRLTDRDDEKTVQRFVRSNGKDDVEGNISIRLPDYHSRWFDVGRHSTTVIKPVQSADEIIDGIASQLPKRRRAF